MKIITTHEIIKPCIEYKEITFTEHWCKNKNQKWVAVDDMKKILKECIDTWVYNQGCLFDEDTDIPRLWKIINERFDIK